jgi:hypothetical protein
MAGTDDFITAVRRATSDTPYAVRETSRGFDLTIDVADARWATLLKAHGLKKVFTHQVRLDGAAKTLSITDVSNTLAWGAGGTSPRLHAEARTQRGRVYEKSFRKEYGVDLRTGDVGKVVDYSFSAGEGRDLVREVAREQGWEEKMGGTQKGAVVFAGIVVALLVLGGLGVLVAQLL